MLQFMLTMHHRWAGAAKPSLIALHLLGFELELELELELGCEAEPCRSEAVVGLLW